MMATLIPAHLSILSASLKAHSFQVDLFDSTYYKTEEVSFDQRKVELLQIRPFNLGEKGVGFKQDDIYKDLLKKVLNFHPDLIGITIVEDTYELALNLLENIKGVNVPVIAGGVFVTFQPDEVIANETVDMICIGEGEEALVELCQKMSQNEDYSTINNLWVKKGGKIVKNLVRPLAELEELAKRYKEINIPFWCQTRPETVSEEKMKILKSMNCDSLQFGIEHGNEEFRSKVLNRHYSNKNMIAAFKAVEKYNVPYTVNNIIGFPDETRELIFDTIEINHQINPRTINCYIFAPYKDTSLYDYCIKENYLDNNTKIHHLLDGARLNMDSISYEELKGLQRTFPLYARFPKSEWSKIKIAEKSDDFGNRMFEEFSNLYRERYFK